MASIGDVFLRLVLDDSDFEKQVVSKAQKAGTKAGQSMGANLAAGISKGATNIGRTLGSIGQNLTKTGGALTANLTLPLVAAGGAAAKFALDFDTTLRQVVGLTDVTQDEIAGIREQLIKLGPEVGKSPQELAKAFYFVASAGFDASEAMDVLETAAKASAAGLGDTQTVAQVLGSVINAYGKENITAARAADILTEAVSQGTAEADQFAGVVGRVVPAASNMGVSFDQVTAALAGMTLTGLSAEEAAVGLNQVFVSLLKPTTQAEAALHEMGLSSEELRRQLREEGLLATLRTLEERFAGNETASAAVFGNVRALRTVTSLLGLDTEQLNKVFAATEDSLGRLQQGYEDTEGPQRDMARDMASLQATAIELGADVLPLIVEVLGEVAGGARSLADWWRSLDKETRSTIVRFLAYAAAAGPVLLVTGKLVTALSVLFKTIGFLAGSKGIPLLVKNLGKAGLLGALIVVSLLLSEASKQMAGFFQEILHGKRAVAEIRTLSDLLGDLGDFAGPAAAALHDLGVTADELALAIEAAGGDVELAAKTILENNGDIALSIGELRAAAGELADDRSFEEWDRAAQRAMHGVQESITDTALAAELEAAGIPPEVAAAMAAGADDVSGGAQDMLAGVAEEAAKAREAAVNHMKAMLAGIANLFDSDETLKEAFQDLLKRMQDPYTEAERRTDIFSQNTIKVIRAALKSGDPKIVSDTKDLVENMLEQIEAMEPGALASGEAVPLAIRDGMDSQVGALIKWVEENVTHETLTALSLEEAQELGLEGIYLYAQGMDRNRHLVEDAARAVRLAAAKPLLEGVDDAGRFGANTAGSYAGGIRANLERARTAGDALGRAARDAMIVDATGAGNAVGWDYILGIAATIESSSAASRIQQALQLLSTATIGGSLPTEGPFAKAGLMSGATSIAAAWLGMLAQSLKDGAGDVAASLAGMLVAPGFAGLGAYPTGALSPVTSAATAGAGGALAGSSVSNVTNYNLTVAGRVSVDEAEDAIDELRRLGEFGGRR